MANFQQGRTLSRDSEFEKTSFTPIMEEESQRDDATERVWKVVESVQEKLQALENTPPKEIERQMKKIRKDLKGLDNELINL